MERKWSNVSDTQNEGNILAFLDGFETVGKSINNKQLKLKQDLENNTNAKIPERKFSICERTLNASRHELEPLLIEALYTIKHKVGRTIDGHSDYINDLYTYVQEAFRIPANDQERLLSKTDDEKPPLVFVNIEVVEAINLEAKDANGFSDPYCMLGIVPGSRKLSVHDENSGNSDDENLGRTMSRKSSKPDIPKPNLLRRLSTFRKSEKNTEKIERKKSNTTSRAGALRDGKLPAKYIQTTDVKKATLNPVWMEKFRFKIDDLNSDTLHLDIWDHDDEFSVVEAARKLNEVKSFKGLDRYFKQIAQSARTNKASKESHVDDFLGSVNISLNDIPSNGTDKWYDLEGRTDKSNVEGRIRIKLSLATREDRGDISDECNYSELKEHERLMSVFIDCDLGRFKGKNDEWKGDLCKEAETILHQHAIQGDITDIQIAMCRWIAYSRKHVEKNISYNLLLEIFQKFDAIWKPTSSSRDEMDTLRESFTLTINNCFRSLSKLRESYPVSSKASLEKLECMLSLIDKIYNSEVFKYCCPFQNSVTHEVFEIIKSSTLDWFEQLAKLHISNKSDDDQLKKLVDLIQLIILDLYRSAKYYHPIFEKTLNVPYFNLVFKKFDTKLYDLVSKVIYEEFGDETNATSPLPIIDQLDELQISNGSPSHSPKTETSYLTRRPSIFSNYGLSADHTAFTLYELYVLLYEFTRFSLYMVQADRINLKTPKYYEFFYVAITRWIELIKQKCEMKIDKLTDLDKNDATAESVQFSASSVELTSWFVKITNFWKLLAWPNEFGAMYFAKKLIDELSILCLKYSMNVFEAQFSNLNEDQKSSVKENIFKKCCITANNIERVRESFKTFQCELDNQKQIKSPNPCTDSMCITSINDALNANIEKLIDWLLKSQIESEMESHLFYYFESPESSPAQESISRLIRYLDSNLVAFKDNLIKPNFERLLAALWIKILYKIKEFIMKDNSRTTMFFIKLTNTLDILVAFLNAENQGLSKDTLLACEKYKELKQFLKYAQIDTNKLLLLYYQEMIAIQNSLKTCEFGQLFCSVCYHSKDETLCVEVIKCKNLQPMDPNGLSDPYVEVELKPCNLFPHCDKKTTTIVKKCLNPMFNETFEFKVSDKLCRTAGTVIHFTVMDHDLMWMNDFEGEAFIELSSIPGLNNDLGDGGFKDLKHIELSLIQPKNYPSLIWDILEMRTYDKIAAEFVKTRKNKIKP